MKKQILTLIGCTLLLAACKSDDGGGEPTNPEPDGSQPVAATLFFPENNTECSEGTVLSDTESTVTFEWGPSENTDSYTVNLKNLDTGNYSTHSSNVPGTNINLLRGTPYEWSVTSASANSTKTASSSVWKFYNQGPGLESHAPFPAEVISPKRGSSVLATESINLIWTTNDIDDDIGTYEVFFGVDQDAMSSLGTVSSPVMNDVEISSNNTYYWKVITIDNANNSSSSDLFDFLVE